MPPRFTDAKSLNELSAHLDAIARLLDQWREAATGEAPDNAVSAVAERFGNILNELQDSGPNGEEVREHLNAIAEQLGAAAGALEKAARS